MLEAPVNTLLLATSNPHKVKEVASTLAPLGWHICTLQDVANGRPLPEEPVEDAPDFEGNAAIKAKVYAAWSGLPTLADDSGLVVDALDGAPGVHSARWSGVDGDRATRDAANNKKLVQAIEPIPQEKRSARFVCVLCLAEPDGLIRHVARGTMEGHITSDPRGKNGFGYDPHLMLPDGRTSAELSPEEKNDRSHRGQACRALAFTLGQPDTPQV
jgi:XTP/dITP diphosphohydrolase